MAQGTSAGVSIPKPVIVQQTWGNSLANAIEAERARNFEKNMIDEELAYKRNKDLVTQANWDQEFDLKKSQAKTSAELLQAQVVRTAKQNEMLSMDLENARNQMAEKEAYTETMTNVAANEMEKKERERQHAELVQKANEWSMGGIEATAELNKQQRESGVEPGPEGWLSSAFNAASYMAPAPFGAMMRSDPVQNYMDYMGGASQEEYAGVSDYQAQQSPQYVSEKEMFDQYLQTSGGQMTPEAYKLIMGQDLHTINAINKMPNQAKMNFVQSNLPKLLMQNQY